MMTFNVADQLSQDCLSDARKELELARYSETAREAYVHARLARHYAKVTHSVLDYLARWSGEREQVEEAARRMEQADEAADDAERIAAGMAESETMAEETRDPDVGRS